LRQERKSVSSEKEYESIHHLPIGRLKELLEGKRLEDDVKRNVSNITFPHFTFRNLQSFIHAHRCAHP